MHVAIKSECHDEIAINSAFRTFYVNFILVAVLCVGKVNKLMQHNLIKFASYTNNNEF